MQLLSNLLSNHCNSNRLDKLSTGNPIKMQKRKIKELEETDGRGN
jgi:hypothetical protein